MPKIREKPELKNKLMNLQTYVTRLVLADAAPTFDDLQQLLKMVTAVIDYCEKRKRY